MIGDYARPKTRLPGAGGATEIATSAKEIFVMLRMTPRAFVERLDFVTSLGHGEGGDSRARSGAQGRGPTRVITDLGILEPDAQSRELRLTTLHPGATFEQAQAACGWKLAAAPDCGVTPAPTPAELAALRAFKARTAAAGAGRPKP